EKEQGKVAEARGLFRRASEADPKHAPTLQAWALLEKEQGEIEAARALFRRASKADPKHAPTWEAWALLEKGQGRLDQACRLLEDGLQRVAERRDRARLLSILGSLLADQRRYQEAEAHFRQALDLHEHDPLTHYHFAVRVLLPTGRREEACKHLRRALELRPRKERDRRRIEQALKRECK
ncbi:MAG: tetratricopeptide repeat protein, partial [Anaerolineae bacterium]|nr:tetratricopeptide repeat protein [Anaerolineae bacterium]